MVTLLILKHLNNLNDDNLLEHWSENAYYQYLSGGTVLPYGIALCGDRVFGVPATGKTIRHGAYLSGKYPPQQGGKVRTLIL